LIIAITPLRRIITTVPPILFAAAARLRCAGHADAHAAASCHWQHYFFRHFDITPLRRCLYFHLSLPRRHFSAFAADTSFAIDFHFAFITLAFHYSIYQVVFAFAIDAELMSAITHTLIFFIIIAIHAH
jgi:hypothetical protein